VLPQQHRHHRPERRNLSRADSLRAHAPPLVPVADLLAQVEAAASADAYAGGFGLAVAPGPPDVLVAADPEILAAALAGLLDNAFKHSRSHGHIALTTRATADRVRFEVQDECGGLPSGDAARLEHGRESAGLVDVRRHAAALGAEIHVRDLPGQGCVFVLEVPRRPPG
jgi:signal transduction histidine kinase